MICWQPIETAPIEEGAESLLWVARDWNGPHAVCGVFLDGKWCDLDCEEFRHVTHWAPINPPPEDPVDA